MKSYIIITFLLIGCMQVALSAMSDDIVYEARQHISSTKWSVYSDYGTGTGTNKCNQFVYDVLKKVGANPPRRWSLFWWIYAPIGAGEWGNPSSSYLTNSICWNTCTGSRQVGDVIGDRVHVGIITGQKKTTSAARFKVVENDWGFRSESSGSYNSIKACWRYTC